MVSHRLTIGLCAATILILFYYFTIIDLHILPVIYIDRSSGESIALLAPVKFKQVTDLNDDSEEQKNNEEKNDEEEKRSMEERRSTVPAKKVPYDSIFIYRAYYDDRASNGTVRVLLMSKCIKDQNFFQIRVGSEVSTMDQRPVEGSKCPWGWAPGCKWNAYALESLPMEGNPKTVTLIVNGTREIELDVHRIHKIKKRRIQVCVPPLFWYTDWPRMILFFEMWKKHNPTFIIYANSISSKVMKVLEHYQKQDLVQIVNWPLLPLAENGEDPNLSIYRLSHSLAHNDCVMRMRSEFGALVDIDEYLHLMDGRKLIDFAADELKMKSNLASWNFNHHGLFITPLDETFEGIHKANVVKLSGPPKTFFRPDKVKFLSTHWVNKHIEKFKSRAVFRKEGVLMHNRVSFGGNKRGDEVTLGKNSPFTDSLLNSTLSVSHKLFGEKLPHYENVASIAMQACNGKWRSQGCKVPLINCRADMMPLDDWIFMNATSDSHYSVV